MSHHKKSHDGNVKFCMGDYVGDKTQQAKFQTHRPVGGFPASGWNITVTFFVTIIFDRFPILNQRTHFYAV